MSRPTPGPPGLFHEPPADQLSVGPAGADQPGLVGGHHGLDAVAHAELGQHAGDVTYLMGVWFAGVGIWLWLRR